MLSLRSILHLSPRTVTISPSCNVMWPAKFEEPLRDRKAINDIRRTPEFERKLNVPVKAAVKARTVLSGMSHEVNNSTLFYPKFVKLEYFVAVTSTIW